jgi:uncharacterized lipoprotein YbaY
MVISGTLRVFDRGEVGALIGVVRLEDVTLADAPSRIIAMSEVRLDQGVNSVRFDINVDAALDARARYTLSARLEGEHRRAGRQFVFGTVASFPWQPDAPPRDQTVDVRPWTRDQS